MNKKLDELIEQLLGIKNPILKVILKAGLFCVAISTIYGSGKAAGDFLRSIME